MNLGTPGQWWYLITLSLNFVYVLFLIFYLNDTKKYQSKMNKRDRDFRKVAVVVSWIDLVLTGLSVVAIVIMILTGTKGYGVSSSPGIEMSNMGLY